MKFPEYISKKLLILASLCILFSTTAGSTTGNILRVSDGAEIPFSEMIDDIKKVRLIFVGEERDQIMHHYAQFMIIRALFASGHKVAIGLELFQASDQQLLNQWMAGKYEEADLNDFVYTHYRNWRMPWPLYRDIFLYARRHHIPLIGLNVPFEILQQIAREGFSSLSPKQVSKLPGVSCNVDPSYRTFIQKSIGSYGKDQESFTHFCETQMVWDTTMAFNLNRFLEDNPDHILIVLAGKGHCWKQGIPEQIRRTANISYRVILPETMYTKLRTTVSYEDADYLLQGI
jgi:uncharacterized iron-regulated protein